MRNFVIISTLAVLSILVSLSIVFTWPQDAGTTRKMPKISEAQWITYLNGIGQAETRRFSNFASLLASAQVLGESDTQISPTQTTKESYKIALLGDSMIDTLGDFPYLAQELSKYFPQTEFKFYNYGAGATNIETGLSHLLSDYTYLGQKKTALLNVNPDIVVVESFAYNHWDNTQGDLDRQWLAMADIACTVKRHSKDIKIIFAATIAPYCPTYTDGSANLPPERKLIECETVKNYLKNTINFANSQNYPLADAYSKSLVNGEGLPNYINQKDHIHPSEFGQQLFSQKVAEKIAAVIE
jgi:hypothetical protein